MRAKYIVMLLSVALAGGSMVVAQDTSEPSDAEPPRARPRAKLVRPWSDLSTLNQEQKEQIIEIHANALEAMRQVRAREHADIMAVLTEENKAELTALEEKRKAEARARRAGSRTAARDDTADADTDDE